MGSDQYEWHPRPPNLPERMVAGLISAAFLLASASDYADWRVFGDYDKAVAVGVTMVGLLLLVRFFPAVRQRR